MSAVPAHVSKQVKKWPAWVVLALVVGGFLWYGSTRGSGPRTVDDRVASITKRLACPVCDGESVYESANDASAAIRSEVRLKVTTTDASDDQIIAYIVRQYSAKTQLVPSATGFDSLVWVLPVVALVCAAVGLFFAFRRWRANVDTVPDEADRRLVAAALAENPVEEPVEEPVEGLPEGVPE
jgi:cytochrome c-type biogenesis protein CcmH